MIFNEPRWFYLLVVIIPLTICLRRGPFVRHPFVCLMRGLKPYRLLACWPAALLLASLVAAVAALARPQRLLQSSTTTMEQGRDIVFALDFSQSMGSPSEVEASGGQPVEEQLPEERSSSFSRQGDLPGMPSGSGRNEATQVSLRRIDVEQAFFRRFITVRMERQKKNTQSEKGDAIGFILFAQEPRIVWPLDRKLEQLLQHSNFVPSSQGYEGLGAGTNFGGDYPGPIDLAAEHFAAFGYSQSRVLVLVTDGEMKIEPDVKARLVDVITSNHIRLYLVGVGGEIVNKQKATRKEVDIVDVARLAGGRVFIVRTVRQWQACFASIDAQEASPVPCVTEQSRQELFPLPLCAAFILWGLSVVSDALLFGR